MAGANSIIYYGLCFAQFCTFAAYAVVTAGAGGRGWQGSAASPVGGMRSSDCQPPGALPLALGCSHSHTSTAPRPAASRRSL